MAAVPNLASSLQTLLSPLIKGFQVPPVPQSTPRVGVSSPAALASAKPAVPNMSVYNPSANMSVYRPATPTVAKPATPAVPKTSAGGIGYSAGVPVMNTVAKGSFDVTPKKPTTPALPAAPKTTTKQPTPTSASLSSAPAMPKISPSPTPSAAVPQMDLSSLKFLDTPSQTPSYTAPMSAYEGMDLFSSREQRNALEAYQKALMMSPEEENALKSLANLNSSASQAYVGISDQPIPLPFITGRTAAVERRAAALAQPLEAEVALLQAKRQLAGEASKTALDTASSRLEAIREFSKPISLAAGTGAFNPLTGGTVAQGMSLADKNALDTFFNLQQTYPDAQISWDPTQSAQVNLQRAQTAASGSPTYEAKSTTIRSVQLPGGGLGFYNSKDGNVYDSGGNVIGNIGSASNPRIAYTAAQGATATADAASLKKQQEYADSTERAFNTATDNLNAITSYMQTAGVNQSNVPIINQLTNKVKAKLLDAGTIAAYQAALTGLRAEYAQVLSRGGEVTEGQRAEAKSLIPDSLSPAQLNQVAQRLSIEGANAIKEARAQVGAIQARMSQVGGAFNNAPANTGGVPSGWSW